MDAIEFNKTLSEAHSISSKLAHRKKCLLNAEIWASSILLLNYFTVV
jgi:hypothetical protein